jgi:hypothetical protein
LLATRLGTGWQEAIMDHGRPLSDRVE